MRLRARLASTARAAVAGVTAATARLAYRRQELVLVALLAAAVVGGFAIQAWHRGAPALLDRLEAEPPRLARLAGTRGAGEPAPRPGRAGRRACDRSTPAASPREAPPPAPSPARPIDLDRATPGELQQLPGIGPRLAARILARREALGGRFRTFDDLASVPGIGARRVDLLRPLVSLATEPGAVPATPARDDHAAAPSPPP